MQHLSSNFSLDFLNIHPRHARLAVAVSGGGDSLAMLHLLHEKIGPSRLVVLHYNHQLRDEADSDQAWLEQHCATLQIPCLTGLWETPAVSNKQQAARRARYSYFTQMCRQLNLIGLCVAHTKDDVAETLLMRLGRGSGVQGLSGMQVETQLGELTVFRPLLNASRQELREYLEEKGEMWLEDSSNKDFTYLRPRVRAGIATLKDLGVPTCALADAAASIQRANIALEHVTDAFMTENTTKEFTEDGEQIFVSYALFKQPEEIAQRAVEKLILTLKPAPIAPRLSKRLRLVESLKNGQKAATLGGVKFECHVGCISCSIQPEIRSGAGEISSLITV